MNFAPVAGYGWTNAFVDRSSVAEYRTQRPSGEKVAPVSVDDRTPPNGVTLRSLSENCQSVVTPGFSTSKSSTSPNHDWGTWASPAAGVVSRSGALLPSAACTKTAASPSRADWKATREPSGDQTGAAAFPPKVIRRSPAVRSRSNTPMNVSLPSLLSSAMCLPSRERRGAEYGPVAKSRSVAAPDPSTHASTTPPPPPGGPGT